MKVLKEKITEFIFGDTDGLLRDSDIQISGLFRILRHYLRRLATIISHRSIDTQYSHPPARMGVAATKMRAHRKVIHESAFSFSVKSI